MTQARSHLIPAGSSGTYHCVQRCVRRAFLCGIDHYTQKSFEHRKVWVEQRIALVGECFAVAVYAYAVMSNHLHLVLHVEPAATAHWSDEEVSAITETPSLKTTAFLFVRFKSGFAERCSRKNHPA